MALRSKGPNPIHNECSVLDETDLEIIFVVMISCFETFEITFFSQSAIED